MEILYEDNDILAINKPAGLVVHPVPQLAGYGTGPDGKSVSEWFVNKYPEAKDVGEKMGEVERPGIVHRIDRETSGILLLAKTKEGHKVLKEQFQNREIEKVYHLFVYGNITENYGTIKLPITRSKKDFRKRTARPAFAQGFGAAKEARTDFAVLKRTEDKSATLVEAKPRTGRTHQIRVHFQAIHHAILGDKLYAPKKPQLLDFERLALHARQIKFRDVSGVEHTVSAKYPKDFQKAIDMLH
ncbi:MAG: RluA family pseudouridine synthase [Candidatus Zambryskibacteria bacterium]|nr:RluA family pseudouridine synthase [Candidatus Zambryskibacteria bacterium]